MSSRVALQLVFWTSLIVLFCGCMKPKDTGVKTSDLAAQFSVTASGGIVWCEAYFYLKTDASKTPVPIDEEDLATCNGLKMNQTSGYLYRSFGYVPNTKYTIHLLRAVDGSVLTQSYYMP